MQPERDERVATYPEDVMAELVELTVELVEPYIPHLVRVLGSYDPTYRDAARDALTRLVPLTAQKNFVDHFGRAGPFWSGSTKMVGRGKGVLGYTPFIL